MTHLLKNQPTRKGCIRRCIIKYFYDTEFIENGKTIDLISIGIVAEDGREYYAQSSEFNAQRANKWVIENVFPQLKDCPYVRSKGPTAGNEAKIARSIASTVHLHKYGQCIPMMNEPERWQCPWRTRTMLAHELKLFFRPDDNIELWGYYSAYDHVAFCQLFGTMMDLPKGYPMYTNDLKQWCDALGNPKLPEQEVSEHHALADARHHWLIWRILKEYEDAKSK